MSTHPIVLNHILEAPNKTQEQLRHIQGEMALDHVKIEDIVNRDNVHEIALKSLKAVSSFCPVSL